MQSCANLPQIKALCPAGSIILIAFGASYHVSDGLSPPRSRGLGARIALVPSGANAPVWSGPARLANVYICSTRRRKPSSCSNTLALPMQQTEDDILGIKALHLDADPASASRVAR